MSDIVERIRKLRYVHVPVASHLMTEAAAEIERLRSGGACPHVRGTVTQHCSLNFTLTDAERDAIKEGADALYGIGCDDNAATIRNLLARLA